MSKYVIDIPGKYYKANVLIMGTDCGKIITEQHERNELPELNADYINEHFGDLHEGEYEVAYQKGQEDMHKAIFQMVDMNGADRMDAFGMVNSYDILTLLSPSEFYAKLTAYEVKKKADDEIKVGDEVTYTFKDGTEIEPFVVFKINDDGGNRICEGHQVTDGMWVGGGLDYKKTGRHFPEVADLLKKMKGGAE